MQYEWDPAKAEANLAAHGVSFAEAVTVLEDDFALTREDPDSEGEQRFVTLGMSSVAHLMVVVYTYREPNVIRIISAWRANRRGPVIPAEPGKTKISIRLDKRILDYFRSTVEKAGGGNYQTLINDALMAYIQQQSMLEAVRQAVREELQSVVEQAGLTKHLT